MRQWSCSRSLSPADHARAPDIMHIIHSMPCHACCEATSLIKALTWEQGLSSVKLGEDAAQAPHVNGWSIRETEYHFWRPIIA